ncbi:MAG: CehA/McbA family metallohydrolase [SAR202 cluster bacterium]|nr:CehA/McbA family metallohydrolase [SAR202 cluster bacterium]
MKSYQTINISNLCNVGSDVIFSSEPIPQPNNSSASDVRDTGMVLMKGLPFDVGNSNSSSNQRFLMIDKQTGSTRININSKANKVIFAHNLLESTVDQDGVWGKHVADYVFHYNDGSNQKVKIKERFQLGTVPGVAQTPGGYTILEAETDEYAEMYPRYSGEWEVTGFRKSEARGDPLRRYFLWSWDNPHTEKVIEYIDLIPIDLRILIGGVTLSHLEEHPFARNGNRPIGITLKNKKHSEKPFDLEVEVDRGRSNYTYPLSDRTPEEFLMDPYHGWGDEKNEKSSPAYVNINAIPSATVKVKQGGIVLEEFNWGDLQEHGFIEKSLVRIDLLDPGRNWVSVKIYDDQTNELLPCRIHFRSPEGIPYQPYGHQSHVNSNLENTFNFDVGADIRIGQATYAYINGNCEGWLPRGDVFVDIAAGFEFKPLRKKVEINPETRNLEFRLQRWINMNDIGWYSGDPHTHFVSTISALNEGRSEGVNLVHVEQTQSGSAFITVDEFLGTPITSDDGKNIVSVCQENRQGFMSHLLLLNLKKPVMPFCTDGKGEAEIGGTMETTLSHWADECHAQGGTVISAHFWGFNREMVALVPTGRIDALEFKGHQREYTHKEYYKILNSGYQIPLIGGTDKMSTETPIGYYRTYVKFPDGEDFTLDNWCKNVSLGKTFMTAGPIIDFTVNGHEPGSTVKINPSGYVDVVASAESVLPIHRLDVLMGGEIVGTAFSEEGTYKLEIKKKIKVDSNNWFAIRVGSPSYYGPPKNDTLKFFASGGAGRGIYAHTGPIYVACENSWWMFDPEVTKHMLELIEGDLSYINNIAGRYPNGLVTHRHTESEHLDYLSQPFIEAREAINNRINELGVSI